MSKYTSSKSGVPSAKSSVRRTANPRRRTAWLELQSGTLRDWHDGERCIDLRRKLAPAAALLISQGAQAVLDFLGEAKFRAMYDDIIRRAVQIEEMAREYNKQSEFRKMLAATPVVVV